MDKDRHLCLCCHAGLCGPATEKSGCAVNSITLNATSANLIIADTKQLTANVMPSNATDKTLAWSSDNTNVATVNSSGLITAISAGSATITCKANDGSGVSATCSVTVGSPNLKGDVNGDGEVNGTDLVALTNMILGRSAKTSAADVSGDGDVNGTDYVMLVNIILGK
ncbi:MAG: Ig domain-containing protein [Prevotella sp.]|nr:Ig domain-containing protein [Prevotella sp.]